MLCAPSICLFAIPTLDFRTSCPPPTCLSRRSVPPALACVQSLDRSPFDRPGRRDRLGHSVAFLSGRRRRRPSLFISGCTSVRCHLPKDRPWRLTSSDRLEVPCARRGAIRGGLDRLGLCRRHSAGQSSVTHLLMSRPHVTVATVEWTVLVSVFSWQLCAGLWSWRLITGLDIGRRRRRRSALVIRLSAVAVAVAIAARSARGVYVLNRRSFLPPEQVV